MWKVQYMKLTLLRKCHSLQTTSIKRKIPPYKRMRVGKKNEEGVDKDLSPCSIFNYPS